MGTKLSELGYAGNLQYYVWPADYPPVNVAVWMYGGGGGGGGAGTSDTTTSRYGGYGSGGGLAYSEISLNPGDRLSLALGKGGQGGYGGAASPGLIGAIRGEGGAGLEHTVLTSLGLHAQDPTKYVRVSLDSRWTNFLNTEGIWINPYQNPWEDEFTVNIPYTGNYTFEWSVDDTIIWRVDGTDVTYETGGFRNVYTTYANITKGTHTIGWRARNARGPYGLAFKIYLSFSGGNGTNAGVPPAGAGGGGGGASVLLVNDVIRAVASGGAGGGGRGRNDYIARPDAINAPNLNAGNAQYPTSSGGDGQSQGTSGAGAGGGGGGYRGGDGGPINSGDTDAQAGLYGVPLIITQGSIAGGILPSYDPRLSFTANKYYNEWRGRGGRGATGGRRRAESGTNGVAYLEFEVNTPYLKNAGIWQPLKRLVLRHNNRWRAPDIWVKSSGIWNWFINPAWSPIFVTTSDSVNNDRSRPYGVVEVAPRNAGPY